MMKRFPNPGKLWWLAAAIILISSAQPALGAEEPAVPQASAPATHVPQVMSYTGYLADASGRALPDGRYDLTLTLYTEPRGGTRVWTEEHKNVRVENGGFNLLLGKGQVPRPFDIPFNRPYFLGVRMGDDPEMMPRIELATAAYAFRARTADEVRDGAITTEKLAPGSVTDDKIRSVSWSKITEVPEAGSEIGSNSTKWDRRGNARVDDTKHFLGTTQLADLVFRTDNVERMRIKDTGTLEIVGGLVVGEDLDVGRDARIARDLDISQDVRIARNLTVNPTGSPSFEVRRDGQVVITSTKTGADSDRNNYPLFIDAQDQGVAIKTKGSANAVNNFISFWDDGGMVGRIEGQNAVDVLTDPQWILNTTVSTLGIAVSIANEVAALTSANACAGVGVVACPPIPSWNVEAIIEIGLAITQETVSQAFLFANLGVSYQSASGDYAEWLERVDPSERIEAGDIVGVFGGKIAKSTTGAEQILVVSRSPIVLGNMPKEGQEYLYDKVAFLGQVPVKVTGVVNEGDYIIPSGFDDGSGIAVSPELMTADEYAKVVGRAWSGSRRLAAKYVNAAIGLNSADVASLIQKQQTELAQLKAEMRRVSELDAKVERLQRALEKLQGAASIAHGTSADGFAATVDSHR